VERLLRLVGDANVAVITDDNVAKLYGPLVIGALKKAGIDTEVAAVRAGEKHKTLHQAVELLDWLTGTQKAAFITGTVLAIDGGELAG
jgi:3-dehydroquinate synthetase